MINKFNYRVAFYDVDSMNVVWHGNYVKFCEAARCDFLRQIGYTYEDMRRDGYAYPIVKMDFKFIAPAFFDEEISVEVELAEAETLLKLKYTVSNAATGAVLCKATTAQAAVKIDARQTQFFLPECLREKLRGIK